MILTGQEIIKRVRSDEIHISPFCESQVNPNSYNFRLHNILKVYTNDILDPKIPQETVKITIPEEGIILGPNRVYLGCTFETMGSNKYVPIMNGRSSTGRLGLFVHITADLIDIGSINRWTLQMHATQEVRIYPDMMIGQVSFWRVDGEIDLYKAKYQGSNEPMESQIWRDFQQTVVREEEMANWMPQ